MEQELISKKDLLIQTGISYGQLYRWKRKKLIPEEWFIRKSTFTGQETFFLKTEVLERIERIKSMKDDLSLDEMVNIFTDKTEPLPAFFSKSELLERNIVSPVVLEQFAKQASLEERFSFVQVTFFYLLDMMLKAGEISRGEGEIIYHTIEQYAQRIQNHAGGFFFTRKMGVPVVTIVSPDSEVYFDDEVRVIAQYSFGSLFEEVKLKLQGGKKHGW